MDKATKSRLRSYKNKKTKKSKPRHCTYAMNRLYINKSCLHTNVGIGWICLRCGHTDIDNLEGIEMSIDKEIDKVLYQG